MEKKNEVAAYLENISLLLLGLFFLLFPLTIVSVTTDFFVLPKQILLGVVAGATLLLFGAKLISEGNLRLRKTPLDLPVALFAIAILLSALFSVNRIDGLIAFAPFFFAILLYFTATNFAKSENSLSFLVTSFVAGACVTTIISILAFLKIHPIPFAFTKVATFTPVGSLLDQAIYLSIVLAVAASFAWPVISGVIASETKQSQELKHLGFAAASILLVIGLCITIYQLVLQRPLLLPFPIGFQTAFAAISQDTSRLFFGFLFGSGYGTYLTDFTRFKPTTINLDSTLWSATFFRSSSYVLELLATTGVIGLLTFGFLIFRLAKYTFKKASRNQFFTSLLLLIAAALILPFSPVIEVLLIMVIILFVGIQGLHDHHNFYDVDLKFVAFKHGFMPLTSTPSQHHETGRTGATKFLPVSLFIFSILLVALLGFFGSRFVASDIQFQNSLVASAANNGLQTYNSQVSAISLFPWRDGYYRIYSQTNLALANSLASQQPANTRPSEQVQQTITTLIQQSINSARTATTISPLNTGNWQNLSSIYRSLIGFGENAEQFAIATSQQATALDPNNPQQYVNLGGIYYQLQQWDNAQRQFQIAVNLKPDYANAYYNLGHALENKGDLQNALTQYQAARSIIANDAETKKKLDAEIAALEVKIGSAAKQTSTAPVQPSATGEQQPLGVNTPATQLPQQQKPVEIPGPNTTPSVTPAPSVSPTP